MGSLFHVGSKEGYFCALYAPGEGVMAVLDHGSVYGTGYGDTPDDAVWAARASLWGGL